MRDDDFLLKKLDDRRQENALRTLKLPNETVDFCSNDYLGIVRNGLLNASQFPSLQHGSTGSRLLTGNYALIEELELHLADFHESEAALIFNSGYDANVGLLSCIAQKGDTIVYDQLVHASIRDGIRLSFAQSFSFAHNDMNALEQRLQHATGNILVVTEGVFSMDGDTCNLPKITQLCQKYYAHLILDEAHALGVIGAKGQGLAQMLRLHASCLARIYTFGKAAGCHGAVVAGSHRLREYLINFSRSFIFSTALPEVAVWAIKESYSLLPLLTRERQQLQAHIIAFNKAALKFPAISSKTPIQGILCAGNNEVKALAAYLQHEGFDVRPILYPTVPKGGERLRIVLHAFNTHEEVRQLLQLLA